MIDPMIVRPFGESPREVIKRDEIAKSQYGELLDNLKEGNQVDSVYLYDYPEGAPLMTVETLSGTENDAMLSFARKNIKITHVLNFVPWVYICMAALEEENKDGYIAYISSEDNIIRVLNIKAHHKSTISNGSGKEKRTQGGRERNPRAAM